MELFIYYIYIVLMWTLQSGGIIIYAAGSAAIQILQQILIADGLFISSTSNLGVFN